MSGQIGIRLSGVSVLLADTALVAGLIVALLGGLGPEENLPLTSPDGLARLQQLRFHYTLRELLLLAYPVFLLPQGIALFYLLRRKTPALLWPLTFWSVGLTIGIVVDVFTVSLASGLGGSVLAVPREFVLQVAGSVDLMIRLAQFIGDNLSGTLAVPFFAVSAYRQGFISRSLAYAGSAANILVCVGYRGVNLIWPGSPWCFVLGFAWYGVIWWDVNIGLMLLRLPTCQMHLDTRDLASRANAADTVISTAPGR